MHLHRADSIEQSRQMKLAQRREQYEATLHLFDHPELFAQSATASKLFAQATSVSAAVSPDKRLSPVTVHDLASAVTFDPVERERERLAAAAFERIVANPKVAVMYAINAAIPCAKWGACVCSCASICACMRARAYTCVRMCALACVFAVVLVNCALPSCLGWW
jgi:hypothetical protein